MGSNTTKYLKLTFKVLAASLVFIILFVLLLRLPFIQTKLANFAVDIISKTTNTEIEIDKIAVNFIDNVSAKGVFLADEKGDTLLYAEKLNVDIGIFKLLRNTVDIDYLELSNSKINIHQKLDSSFSYQFLLDAFPSDSSKKDAKPWTIDIEKIKIKNADYNFDLLQAKNNLKLKELIIKSDEIDLESLFFSISKIDINQMELTSIWKEGINIEKNDIDSLVKKEVINFPLKYLPISLVCKELKIKKSKVKYGKGQTFKSNFFNTDDISAQNINIQLKDIVINESKAQLNVSKINLNLNNQFEIIEANAGLLFSNNEASLNNLYFKTAKSELQIEGKTSYKKFDDLMNFKNGNPVDINLKTLDLAINEVIYFVPFLDTLSYLDNLKNNNLKMSAYAKGTIDDLKIQSLQVEINNTFLDLNGSILNGKDIEQLSLVNFNINALTNVNQLRTVLGKKIILSKYDYFGKIDLETQLNGKLNALNILNLNLVTDGLLKTSLRGQVLSILNINDLSYDLEIAQLKTGFPDIEIFVDSIPDMLKKFDSIDYVGAISGKLKSYKIDGNLLSSLGNASSIISIAFNDDFSNASYDGKVDLDSFNLGELLVIDSLGFVSLKADLKGEGLNISDLNAEIDALITQITYNNYSYKDIELDGSFLQKQFIGQLSIDDENLQFDFDGKVNLNDTVPDLDFNAQLKHINVLALKLSSFPLIASLDVEAKLKGVLLNDIIGDLVIKNISLKNDDKTWTTDSITFKAEKPIEFVKSYELKSTFINGKLEGDYDLLNLSQIFMATVDKYLTISPLFSKDSIVNKPFVLTNEKIHLDLELNQPEQVLTFFNIKLTHLDTAFLHLDFNANKNILELEFFVPSIKYATIYADSIYWKLDAKNDVLDNYFKVDSVSLTKSIYIPGFKSIAKFENQEGFIKNYINDTKDKYSLAANIKLKTEQEKLTIDVQSPLILNGKEWDVENNEVAYLAKGASYIPNFSLSNGIETMSLNYSNDLKSITFTDFNLNNFTDLIEIDSTVISGVMNGLLSLEKHENHLDAKGKLKIDNIKVNDLKVGDLVLGVFQEEEIIIANLDLKDGENYLNISSTYNAEINEAKAEISLFKFNLNTIAPIVQDYAKNLEGFITGNVKVLNNEEEFNVDGALEFTDVAALIVPIETSYKITKGNLKVNNNSIIPEFNISDEIDREAVLSGVISHNNFRAYKFDLSFNTPAFTFLNSKKKEDGFIFGKLVAKVDAKMTGTLDLPKIKGNITTVDESDLSIQLLSEKSIAKQEEYVIFLNGTEYNDAEIDSIANEKYKVSSSFDLDLTVNINEKATVRIVIDPLTGDNLVVNGNGTLAVKIPPYGDIDITGVYTVNSGLYSFSFQKLLKKKFEIVKGSQLKFAGNPMNASLDIQAAYNTDVSVFALVESESASMSSDEQQALKKKMAASVLLNMQGKLSDPKLSFDIKMADNSGVPVGGSLTRALNKIKQNESELNKQVFSLLLFNSFTGTSSSGNISSTGTSTAVRSVGNLINSQLNKLAGKAEGLEISFNLDQYQDQFSDNGSQITDVELGISQTLFNDKIVISVGGNVGLESGQSENGALTNVAGDFILTYNITDDGKYSVKVFQKSNYDALNDSNVWKTGAGFSYQTKFGRLRKKERK